MGEGSTNELYRLDLSSCTWTRVEGAGSLPEPRSFHAMVSVKDKLYVFGGCGTSGRLNDLHSFDSESGSWKELQSSEAIKVSNRPGHITLQCNVWPPILDSLRSMQTQLVAACPHTCAVISA